MAKILILDDEIEVAATCQCMLEDLGHKADIAVNTSQFLDKLEGEKYDILISDIYMPGMDGFLCCRQAIKIRPNINIVIMTGKTDLDEVVKEVLGSSIFTFLKKPFDLNTLAGVVSQIAVKSGIQRTAA